MGGNKNYFFSYQPFWEVEKEEECIWKSEDGEMPIQTLLWKMKEDNAGGLNCIPGIGQMGIEFSIHEKKAAAYVCGVLPEKKVLPVYDMKQVWMMRFSPGSFTRLFDIPSNDISPEGVPLEELFPRCRQIVEAMNESETSKERIRIMEDFIGAYRKDTRQKREYEKKMASSVADYMMEKNQMLRMKDLEEEYGYSARMLQKIITRNIGICPKQLNTQICFQNSICQISRQKEVSLTEVSHAAGFYDQSHFDRTFRKFAGTTPREYRTWLEKERTGAR